MSKEEKNPNVTEENAPKTFSLKIGDSFELSYMLDDDGKPVSADNQQAITDPVLLNAIKANVIKDKPQPKNLKTGIADNFKGLPMRELIGGPLFAAAEAQEKLASIAWDYYQKIAYETNENGTPKQDQTRLLKFTLERPVVEGGIVSDKSQKVNVQAPFIGLVPIPSLLVERIDVDFQMEVTDTNTSKDQSSEELSTDISSKWFGVNVGISGKVTSSRENTRSTNQTAKYQVHVTASQQRQTEGLSKLMDIMASCIEPIPTQKES